MNRDPRFALSQELEAKQTLLDQLRALTADDPDFFNRPPRRRDQPPRTPPSTPRSSMTKPSPTALKPPWTNSRPANAPPNTALSSQAPAPRPHPAANRSQDPAHAHRDPHVLIEFGRLRLPPTGGDVFGGDGDRLEAGFPRGGSPKRSARARKPSRRPRPSQTRKSAARRWLRSRPSIH